MVLELPQFKQDSLEAFVQTSAEAQNIVRRVTSAFPDEKTYDINFVYDFIKTQARKAAKITGFNSSAPIRSRGQADNIVGKITKIMDSYYFDEEDLLKFNKPRDPEERVNIERNFLIGVNDIALGIDDIVEYIAAQLTYAATVKYIDPYTKTQLEFELEGRPAGNDIIATTLWSQPGAKPLDDLKVAVKQYQKTNGGALPDRLDMTSATYEALANSDQVRTMVYGNTTDGRLITDDQVNQLFSRLKLPTPYLNDATITMDAIEGNELVVKTLPHLADGKVVLYANVMGSTVRGVTKEKNYTHGKFVKPKYLDDPEGEQVIVGEAVMPTLKAINSNVIMTVL